MARLSPNKVKRLRQLSSRTEVRAAFDRLRMIPALLLQGMKFGSLPRVLATSCNEVCLAFTLTSASMLTGQEIVHTLNSLLEEWSYYLSCDRAKMMKMDPQTVARLQGKAPGISAQDAREVEGLVLSGAVFQNFASSERKDIWKRLKKRKTIISSLDHFFQNMWYLEACANCMKRLAVPTKDHPSIKIALMRLFEPDHGNNNCIIQTSETDFRQQSGTQADRAELGYRQLWLYAMRHYPKIPRPSGGDDLVAKPDCEKADDTVLHGLAVLAQRLGFNSPNIQQLAEQSPDRQIARDVLLKARPPGHYRFNGGTFESLVTRICDCFSEAIPIDQQASQEPIRSREPKPKARRGLPHRRDQKRDSRFLFLDNLHSSDLQLGGKVTTFFVRQCVYSAFFGRLPDSSPVNAMKSQPFNDSRPDSPLFVPPGDLNPETASTVSQNRERNGGHAHKRSSREAVRQERRQQKREKKRRRRERRDLRAARRSVITEDQPSIPEPIDHNMEEAGTDARTVNVFSPESLEESMADNPEAEESDRFQGDFDRASAVTHIDFDELPEAASHWDDPALSDGTREPSTGEAQLPTANNERLGLERGLDLALDDLPREAGERVVQENLETESAVTAESAQKVVPRASANAAKIRQAKMEGDKSVVQKDSQDMARKEPFRRAEEGESHIASQSAELTMVLYTGMSTSADTTTRISQVDEGPMEHEGQMAKASEDVAEASDDQAGEILHADAEQRTIGNWEPDQRLVERATALAQLENAHSPVDREADSISKHRPVTELHLSDLVSLSAGQTTANLTEAEAPPELNIDPQPSEGATNASLSVHGHQAGTAKQRQRLQAKPSKIQKISTAKPMGRDVDHTTMRAETIDIELEEPLARPQSAERMPVNEGVARRRRVRFDVSHEGAGVADTPEGENVMVSPTAPRISPPATPSGVSGSGSEAAGTTVGNQWSVVPFNPPPAVPPESVGALRPERANLANAERTSPGHSGKRLKASTGTPSRAEKVVTRLDFADWEGDLASAVDDRASPVTTATTPGESERRGRKILTPRIVERRALDVRPRRAGGSSQPVTIAFRVRDEGGTWMTAHEVVVESDPSVVERVARKEARNRQATFYDKNLRKLTPAQCFDAAIEDESNKIFMQIGGELAMDEDTMRSIAREVEL